MNETTVDLKIFDINTSIQDILKKRSAFNPFPAKAIKGILVSRICHPMVNPARWIKYLATGEVYYVHEPISYAINSIGLCEPTTEEKVPNHSESSPWMTMEDYMFNLSFDVVRSEMFKNANLKYSIERSVVSHFMDGRPVFLPAREAHLGIVKESLRLIAEHDYHTAACFTDFASRTGAYKVWDKTYSSPSWQVFEYTGQELATNACPSLVEHHPFQVKQRGRSNIVNETAGEVQSFVILSVSLTSLEKLAKQYSGTASGHIQNVLEYTKKRLANTAEKLAAKSDPGSKSYLDQAVNYYRQNGLDLSAHRPKSDNKAVRALQTMLYKLEYVLS